MTRSGLGMRAVFCCVAGAMLLAGCDPARGVSRKAELESGPAIDCVRRVIPQVEGVAQVQETLDQRAQDWSIRGPVVFENAEFVYRGEPGSRVFGVLRLHTSSLDGTRMEHSSLGMGFGQANVDASLPVLLAVEQRLTAVCGLRVREPVKHRCHQWFELDCESAAGLSD